jgi:hypothetical protein
MASIKRLPAEPSVVYAYAFADAPERMLGVHVPRQSAKTAALALKKAHGTHKYRSNAQGLAGASKALRDLETTAHDYYLLGPAAQYVSTGLVIGADILHNHLGRKVLTVRKKVLTDREYADVFRAVGNRS